MGQASVGTAELPDPLQQAVTSVGATAPGDAAARRGPDGSADDLLSQLAGEEIDRMLAEADATSGEADAVVADAAQELSKAIDVAEAAGPTAASAAAAASADEQISRQLDDVLSAITAKTTPADSASAPAAAGASTPPAAPAVAVADLPAPAGSVADQSAATPAQAEAAPLQPPVAQSSAASSQASEFPAQPQASGGQELKPGAATQEALHPTDPAANDPETQPRDPLYIRLLELINTPLNLFPDAVRDALGKVAILTLMNAVGVLLYVLLFRK